MIKINLLREVSPRRGAGAKSKLAAFSPALLGLLVITVVTSAWHWSLSSQEEMGRARLAELQQEKQRLEAVQVELERFRQQKEQLDSRMAVVETLLANRYGPVNMLNTLIASVPDEPALWLTGLSQSGNRIVIEGNAFEVPAIARFISRLKSQKTFNQVDLDFWEEESSSVKFQLTCQTEN